MQDRLNQNDVTNRVNVEDPQRVRDAVLALFAARYPRENFNRLARAFDDFRALFEGRFSGYFACDTLYHDIRHSLDVTLAMARLIDGHERSCALPDQLGARRAMPRSGAQGSNEYFFDSVARTEAWRIAHGHATVRLPGAGAEVSSSSSPALSQSPTP